MTPVKVSFVGCGGIAHVHADYLRGREDVNIVGCCDTNAERAEALSAKCGASVFRDAETLYDTAKPQAVYIGVPPGARGPCEIEAAKRGIHLFIEKPAAASLDTARKIAAAVRKAKVLTSVGYCFRYSDLMHAAQQALKGQAVSLITGNYHCGMPEIPWWRQRAQSGGQIVEQTTHIIDALRYLCGPVSEVYAVAARGCMSRVKHYDVEDSSAVTLRLKTGAVAAVTSSCVLAHCPARIALDIITPQKAVVFTGNALRITEDHKIVEHQSATNMYAAENEAFINSVRLGKRTGIRATYADALKTLRITLAANESIQTGMPITL